VFFGARRKPVRASVEKKSSDFRLHYRGRSAGLMPYYDCSLQEQPVMPEPTFKLIKLKQRIWGFSTDISL
jgi:hypothetical protein